MEPLDRIREELLVHGAQEGDRDAFRALVEGWQARLWRHAVRLTGRRDAAADALPDPGPAASEEVEGPSEAVALLRRALTQLSGERRALLSLHYVDGLDLAEIAEALGIPVGTVKSRLHHARAELREHIERTTS